jgi:competence protein ComEC
MIDASVLLGLALLAGGILPVSPAPTFAAVLASLWLLRRGFGWLSLGFAVLAVAANAWRAERAMDRFERDRMSAIAALGGPARCVGTGTVVSSPIFIRRRSPQVSPSARSPPEEDALLPSFNAELAELECNGRALRRTMRARLYGGPSSLARGDRVLVTADLSPVEPFRNGELDDARPGGARRGVLVSGGAQDVRVLARGFGLGSFIDRLRARSRARIEATFPREAAPLARALVLGESDLEQADDRAFRASGLSHLLAVSGTHLVLVVAGAVGALGALARRIEPWSACRDVGRVASACGVGLAWLYADFAGGSGSAVRAAAMLSFALGARALGRRPHGPRAFGLSLVGAALVDPLVAFDVSFLLSAAATAGLMLLQKPVAARLGTELAAQWTNGVPKGPLGAVVTALATTIAASIGCAPLIAFLSPTLPVGGVFANLVAVPIGEIVALPLCLAHSLLSAFPLVERGAAVVAAGSLLVVRTIARVTEHADFLMLPVPRPSNWQCAILWVAAVCWFTVERSRRAAAVLVGAALWFVCEVAILRAGAPRDTLRVTVLDVGQGDSSIVDFPDGTAMLVDAGGMVGSPVDPGEVVVAPLLRARRRTALAAVVLSHPHPDHYGGMAAALARVRVEQFWDTGQGEREGAGPGYERLLGLLRSRGVPVRRPAALCGAPQRFGRAVVEVLAPCPEPVPFANANDNSFVLRISLGTRAALLVGDAERAEEAELLRRHASALRADFLKVGHHGSATSSSAAFVTATGAVVAAISCGVRNRFGHPHPVTLQTLGSLLRVYRTDEDGSIRWETDGRSTSVITAMDRGVSRAVAPWSILPGRHH